MVKMPVFSLDESRTSMRKKAQESIIMGRFVVGVHAAEHTFTRSGISANIFAHVLICIQLALQRNTLRDCICQDTVYLVIFLKFKSIASL
jgi:hypothetical protein